MGNPGKYYCLFLFLLCYCTPQQKIKDGWNDKINVFIGDSNTEGEYLDFKKKHRFSTVLSEMKGSEEDNRGKGGRVVQNAPTSCNTDKASFSLIPKKKDTHLFLYIMLGSNDIAQNTGEFTPGKFQIALNSLVENALSKGWPPEKVVLISPPWVPSGPSKDPKDRTSISGAYDVFYDYCGINNLVTEARQMAYVNAVQLVAKAKKVVFADLYTALKKAPNNLSFFGVKDKYQQIHLTKQGHQFLANFLASFSYPKA